jgi:hypothetical protein
VPHRLNAYLASNNELRQLSSKAKQLTALQRKYESFVPPTLARSSHILRLHQQTLVIAANNGAVAAKLRQMAAEFISLFQAGCCEVTVIQIKVQVMSQTRTIPPEPRKLGKPARDALNKLDDNLADSPLKSAIRRLVMRSY